MNAENKMNTKRKQLKYLGLCHLGYSASHSVRPERRRGSAEVEG